MKLRARFTPRLNTWAVWLPPVGWARRIVGFGYTLEEAFHNWRQAQQNAGRFGGGRFWQ